MIWRIIEGDCRTVLPTLPAESVQTCITSPPYWGLRDYGVEGQLGLERTPEEYVAQMVEVFREVRRVLRPDGTLWLNLGDSFAKAGKSGLALHSTASTTGAPNPYAQIKKEIPSGLKPKDLVGIPWRVAFALQADGWWLRSDIIWAKPNPMPESVTDRPTKAHEQVFLLTKSGSTLLWRHRDGRWTRERPAPEYRWRDRETGAEQEIDPGDRKRFVRVNLWKGFDYFYDADAVREKQQDTSCERYAYGYKPTERIPPGQIPNTIKKHGNGDVPRHRDSAGFHSRWDNADNPAGRNRRSVWTISTKSFAGAHFAVMPWDLVEPCVLAGSRPGDLVLDPFAGAGTVGMVARRHGRSFIGIELNSGYAAMARERITGDAPLLNAL
jgi:site-specific DNA-methyltransferase (adenine-specific)